MRLLAGPEQRVSYIRQKGRFQFRWNAARVGRTLERARPRSKQEPRVSLRTPLGPRCAAAEKRATSFGGDNLAERSCTVHVSHAQIRSRTLTSLSRAQPNGDDAATTRPSRASSRRNHPPPSFLYRFSDSTSSGAVFRSLFLCPLAFIALASAAGMRGLGRYVACISVMI